MQSRTKKVLFTALLICFYRWLFIARFASSKQITLVTIVQAVYSFSTLYLSYSPSWGSVALSPYWCAFWKCFSQPSAGSCGQTETRMVFWSCWHTSLCSRFYEDKTIDIVSRTWAGNQEEDNNLQFPWITWKRLSWQWDVKKVLVLVLSKQFLFSIKAGQKHLESPSFPWSSNITFSKSKCQHIIFFNNIFLSVKLQRDFGGVFVSLLCFDFFVCFHLFRKAWSLIQLKWCNLV